MNDDNIGNVIEKKSVITFECTKAEKALFIRAANKGKLVDWIMSVLLKEANRVVKR